MNVRGIRRSDIARSLTRGERFLDTGRLEQIERLADDCKLAFDDLLAFNLYGDLAFQDGCTVMIAMGSASASGSPIVLKNSDKVGGGDLKGPNFCCPKEITVLYDCRTDSGFRILGVSAAGSTGIKMGMNSAGVVAASNIGRTIELKNMATDPSRLLSPDRTQLMREGLEHDSARKAAEATLSKLIQHPMSTPGNIEFVDKSECYIIEGSYSQMAVDIVRGDRAVARTNHFTLLRSLNESTEIAGYKRHERATDLLNAHFGRIDRDKMIEFSMDQANGPGGNSICRYGKDPMEETTLAAMIMEINAEDPRKSLVSIALGKPSYAWRDPEGHVCLPIDCDPEEIPQTFLNGETWKRFYTEDPPP